MAENWSSLYEVLRLLFARYGRIAASHDDVLKAMHMRKWMRERLQRRKKTPQTPTDQPAPPPLQPAYFDAAEQQASLTEAAAPEPEASAMPAFENEPAPSAQADGNAGRPSDNKPTTRRSSAAKPAGARRRRGGRGRGASSREARPGREGAGRQDAVAQAFAPKGIVAAPVGSEPVEEVQPAEYSDADAPSVPAPVASAPEVPPAAVAPQRAPKGVVVLAIGLPGSGKSSWFKRHNVVPLSSDMMRSILFDDVREQRYQDLVFSNLRSMLKGRLIAKRPMNYVDATNLTPQERQHWIKLAKDYGYEVQAVFFDVPLQVCIERHQRRDRVVPEDIMRRMAAKLKAPSFEEGFAKITVVRVKKKEAE